MQKWTIQRNCTQEEEKQKYNTIYVGHHYAHVCIKWIFGVIMQLYIYMYIYDWLLGFVLSHVIQYIPTEAMSFHLLCDNILILD